jgi:hypothetical protein
MENRSVLLSLFSHRTLVLLRWDFHFLRVRLPTEECCDAVQASSFSIEQSADNIAALYDLPS